MPLIFAPVGPVPHFANAFGHEFFAQSRAFNTNGIAGVDGRQHCARQKRKQPGG
jgi:hypothetical protein